MMATGSRLTVAALLVAAAVGFSAEAAAEPAVSILGMAWTPTPRPALVISASAPLEFSESRPAPGSMLVRFAGATLAEPVAQVRQPSAGLERATLVAVEEAGAKVVHLRLELAEGVSASLARLPAGIEVRLSGGGLSQAPSGPRSLHELLPVVDGEGISVLLSADAPLQGRVFTLENPPRVVVDLPGVINRVSRRVHAVGEAGVHRVRVAQHTTVPEPVVRVVVDLEAAQPHRMEATPSGAILRVGRATAAVAAAAPTAPIPVPEPAAEPPPVVTAAVPEAPSPRRTPVEITDAPLPVVTETPAPAPEPAPEPEWPEEPVEPVAPARPVQPEPGPLTAPPVPAAPPPPAPAPVTESPWTTTPAAMAEQAVPTVIATGSRELETEVRRFTGEPIDINLKDADIKDVLRFFAGITGLNIVVDPDVTGSVTVALENVPWDQALDIMLRINRLDYVVENNVLRVARLDSLTREKAEQARFREEEERAKPMTTVTKTLSYARAATVRGVLTAEAFILSPRGSVVVDDRTNQLIIRDSSDRIEGILALIDSLDQPNPQVIIEARIVETTRRFSRALGMAWGFQSIGDAAHGTTTGWKFPHSYDVRGGVGLAVPGFGGADATGSVVALTFSDVLDAFNLDFALQAAETDGQVKIVSAPKVTAQNNMPAQIESGIMIPIQTVANQTVTVQYINATLKLDVTPQITADGTVLLDIDLQKQEPLPGVNIAGGDNAPIITRNARTTVMVRDGGTTVIGGIYQLNEQQQDNAIPGLSRLPLLGNLFRSRQTFRDHDELLLFITPRIVKY